MSILDLTSLSDSDIVSRFARAMDNLKRAEWAVIDSINLNGYGHPDNMWARERESHWQDMADALSDQWEARGHSYGDLLDCLDD